jgi:hypothetical protein
MFFRNRIKHNNCRIPRTHASIRSTYLDPVLFLNLINIFQDNRFKRIQVLCLRRGLNPVPMKTRKPTIGPTNLKIVRMVSGSIVMWFPLRIPKIPQPDYEQFTDIVECIRKDYLIFLSCKDSGSFAHHSLRMIDDT